MSNFDIVYRIATDLTGLKKGVEETAKATDQIDKKLTGLQGTVAEFGRGFASAFSATVVIGAVTALGRELLNDADALEKMADKTGIGVEALQRLRSVGDEAGNSLEDITGAINKLQRGLAEGNTSAIGALEKLGIQLSAIKALQPDQQFLAIGAALEKIPDPAQRTAIAMELFGRSGAEVLPSLLHASDDLKDGIFVMSESSV